MKEIGGHICKRKLEERKMRSKEGMRTGTYIGGKINFRGDSREKK